MVLLAGGPPTLARWAALLLCGGVIGGVGWARGLSAAGMGTGFFALVATVGFLSMRPRHDRAWSEDQARMPSVRIDGDVFTIGDHRSFRYRSVDDWDARWTDETFRFSELVGSDMGVEQFSSLEAVAHTFVSFRFADGRVLVASVEIRKEDGERFSPIYGLFRHYEKMIVLGDERDLVELRAVHREDTVYLYPMQVSREASERFLRSILAETQALHDQPAYYHTLLASCSSSLATHLRALADLPLDPRMFLPGYADALAHELGWLGPEDLQTLRERYTIDARAKDAVGAEDFSARIRTL